MRTLVLLGALALAGALAFPVEAKPRIASTAFGLVADQDYHTTNHSPDACYGDDHGVYWRAEGTLTGSWTYTSRLPVCLGHHLKVHADADAPFTITALDHHGLAIPVRETYIARRSYVGGVLHRGHTWHYEGCNTDAGYWRAYAYPEGSIYVSGFEFSPWVDVSWTITGSGEVTIHGWLAETPSPVPTGGEGSWDWCVYPPPE